jgi:hypothetical protein
MEFCRLAPTQHSNELSVSCTLVSLLCGGVCAHETENFHQGGHFGRHKTAALVRRLANWPGQTLAAEAYVRTCEVCQPTKAEHVGPRGLLHPLQPPARRGRVIGVDWLVWLAMAASGLDQVQARVDHLSGKIHAVPTTRSTDTAADAARILCRSPSLTCAPCGGSPSAYGVSMQALEQQVQVLLHAAAQQERKTALGRHPSRVETTFQVGDQARVLLPGLTAELFDAAEIGKLRPL